MSLSKYKEAVVTDKVVNVIELLTQENNSPHTYDPFKDFVKDDSLKLSVNLMRSARECIISHRFHSAGQMLEALSLECKNTDHFLWKAGFQVLENHENSSDELVSYFLQHIKSLRYVNKREVVLEFIIYLLKKKKFHLARSSAEHLMSCRQRSLRQNSVIDPLLKMYFGIIDYAEWVIQLPPDSEISTEDNSLHSQELMVLANRAISVFLEIIIYPGQWDIVIPKLIHMLKHYKRLDEAESALLQYVEANSFHLNSYIYLYEFYKTFEPSKKKLKKCLNKIVAMSPSDPRTLELCELYREKDKKRKKCLHLLFNYLDYASNKDNISAWSLLANLLMDVKQCCVTSEIGALTQLWECRITYWPSYHFHPDRVNITNKQDGKLAIKKVIVLCLLENAGLWHPYIAAVKASLELLSSKLVSKLLRAVNKVDRLQSKSNPEEEEEMCIE